MFINGYTTSKNSTRMDELGESLLAVLRLLKDDALQAFRLALLRSRNSTQLTHH